MRTLVCAAFAGALALGAGCQEQEPAPPLPEDDPPAPVEPDPPPPEPTFVRDMQFAAFEGWASPIDDYLAVGEAEYPGDFDRRINDLAPLGGRMFFAYGDANFNLGAHIPIELRFFSSAEDSTATPALVDGPGQGAPQTTPYQTGEEQIDRFRVLDGVLWQAGIDSIDPDELHTQQSTNPPSIEGNVYRLEGDVWKKYRLITGGEHVHDVTRWRGNTYGVGSGADNRMEFEAGRVFRYLWQSTDLGATFTTVERVEVAEAGGGDTRWVTLLPLETGLYLFGYESDFSTNTASLRNAVFDGQTVEALGGSADLGRLFPDNVLVLPDGTALVYGADVDPSGVRYGVVHAKSDGSTAPLASLAGTTVIDAALTDTGEVIYLVMAGDAYGEPAPETFDLRVFVADAATPDAVVELLHFSDSLRPASVAFWKGALFLGSGDGRVLRASQTSSEM